MAVIHRHREGLGGCLAFSQVLRGSVRHVVRPAHRTCGVGCGLTSHCTQCQGATQAARGLGHAGCVHIDQVNVVEGNHATVAQRQGASVFRHCADRVGVGRHDARAIVRARHRHGDRLIDVATLRVGGTNREFKHFGLTSSQGLNRVQTVVNRELPVASGVEGHGAVRRGQAVGHNLNGVAVHTRCRGSLDAPARSTHACHIGQYDTQRTLCLLMQQS